MTSPTREELPFLGEFPGLIDDKGRLSVPAEYRHCLPEDSGSQIVLSFGGQHFINVFPLSFYRQMINAARHDPLSFTNPKLMPVDVLLAGGSAIRILDSQGRMTVPSHLTTKAGIGREIVFMGRFTHFVIWDKPAYEKYLSELEITPDQAWQQLRELGAQA